MNTNPHATHRGRNEIPIPQTLNTMSAQQTTFDILNLPGEHDEPEPTSINYTKITSEEDVIK
jgi:hypothetical protein